MRRFLLRRKDKQNAQLFKIKNSVKFLFPHNFIDLIPQFGIWDFKKLEFTKTPIGINQKSHPQKWKAFHWSNY
ncbi:hypothetical protein AB674_14415 [Flavobacterium sp. ABG]|nr:hypothetical protein AB674_14415 [Flavobacterium sp. ABG]